MQFVMFCFTDFVYYCMPIYVPSLYKDFIISTGLLYPIKFILPEFVSYFGKEGCCVWETIDIFVHQSL